MDAGRTKVRQRGTWRGRMIRAALAVAVGLLGAVAGASPASAHAVLVGSSPEADALLQEAPTQVVLTFTEPVNPVSGKVRVIAPDGSRVDRDEARPSGAQLIIPLRGVTQPGTYLVTFRVISADSHPIGGAFPFSFLEVSPGGPPSAEGVGASGFALAALPVARWIGYIGLVLLVGAALVLSLLWPWRLDRTDLLRTAYLGAGLVALGTVLEVVFQVPYVAGGGLGDVTGADVREVLASQYGAAHLVRLGVLGAAVVLLPNIAKGRNWRGDGVLLAVLGAIAVGTWSVSGHAAATAVPTVSVAADMVHLASMSVWLGGLIMLVAFLLPRANAVELGAIVPVWSRWAGYAIAALVLTGVAQSLLEIGTPEALVTTTYGIMILVKVGLVGVVLGVATVSRRTAATFDDSAGLDGEPDPEPIAEGSHRLRRSVFVEAAVALAVIGLTSVLVQVTPARTEAGDATTGGVQTLTLEDPGGQFRLTADVTPARVGINQLHLYATTLDGRPLTIVEWTVKASNTGAGIEGLDAAVVRITPDHAIGQVTLATDGTWRLVFTLRLNETTNGIVAGDVRVRGR
jgi:copper transport protein